MSRFYSNPIQEGGPRYFKIVLGMHRTYPDHMQWFLSGVSLSWGILVLLEPMMFTAISAYHGMLDLMSQLAWGTTVTALGLIHLTCLQVWKATFEEDSTCRRRLTPALPWIYRIRTVTQFLLSIFWFFVSATMLSGALTIGIIHTGIIVYACLSAYSLVSTWKLWML